MSRIKYGIRQEKNTFKFSQKIGFRTVMKCKRDANVLAEVNITTMTFGIVVRVMIPSASRQLPKSI